MHQALEGGSAKDARIYPEALCEAMVGGLLKQMECNVEKIKQLMAVRAQDRIWKDKDEDKLGRNGMRVISRT